MIRFVTGWVFVSLLVWNPMNAKAQDAAEALSQNLIFDDLNEAQVDRVRQLFQIFASKQESVSTVWDILALQRQGLSEVIASVPFNRAKAQEIAHKATLVVEQEVVDFIELRNQIFQVLTPEQQKNYIRILQGGLTGDK